MKIALVVAEFNGEITSEMQAAAETQAQKQGVTLGKIVHVPGSFDAPLAVKRLLERNDIEGVAVLGAILKGETLHDEIIGYALAKQLMELALEYGKPVSNGVIGPGANEKQAKARAREYGERAVEAVIALADL